MGVSFIKQARRFWTVWIREIEINRNGMADTLKAKEARIKSLGDNFSISGFHFLTQLKDYYIISYLGWRGKGGG